MTRRPLRSAARVGLAAAVLASGLVVLREVTPWASAVPEDANCPSTAAQNFNWGEPNRADGFNDPASLHGWTIYNGPGHNHNGIRTPLAVSATDGSLTITADAHGNSGGLAWYPGQLHGRWELCVKSLPSAETYHSVALLWPDAEDWPQGGEVDFMEITDPTRQYVEGFLHHGRDNELEQGSVAIDATQWHAWAVEWTPDHITYFVDGRPWLTFDNPAQLPPRPMHLAVQLDNFGGDTSQGGQTLVDWVRQYQL